MKPLCSTKEICEATGLSKQGVISRAKREKWETQEEENKLGGGKQFFYHTASLPDDILQALSAMVLNCDKALIPVNNVYSRDTECLIDKWECASKKHQRRAHIRSQILKAIEIFCKEKGFKQTKGEEVFALFYNDKQAQGVDDDVYKIEKNISVATVRRWRAAYRQYGLAGLLPNYRSNQGQLKAVTPDIRIFIVGNIKKKPHIRPSHLFKMVSKSFEAHPSRRTIYRYVERWKREHPDVWAMAENPQRWKNSLMPAAGDASAGAEHFCHVWEMDSTPADIITADGLRCTIIGIIDIFSRRAVVSVSPTSKSLAVAACIRKAVLKWGRPYVLRKDRGKDYSSEHIAEAMSRLNIETPNLPAYAGEKKPFIERFFGTYSIGLEELLPCYCGHSVAERQAIRARETWGSKIMTPGATVEVALSMKELQALSDKWIEIYESSPHTGIGGMTPMEKFASSPSFPEKITDERVIDILLAPVSRPRRVLKKGISINRHYYWDNALLDHMGRYVQCRLDVENAGLIYVFKDHQFICKATNEPLTGLRLEEYQNQKKRYVRELKAKTKALDGLDLGNRTALQILVEDSIIDPKKSKIIPLQIEADSPHIQEAKRAVMEIENHPVIDSLVDISGSGIKAPQPTELARDDYRDDEELERVFKEVMEEASEKKALGISNWKAQ